MRHLIDRVLELQEGEDSLEEECEVKKVETINGDEELVELLASLAPRIRVFGCGGCGCNTVQRLEDEGLLSGEHISGFAVNTDAQHLLRSQLNQKILIGRTARGRGAGGDPEKGEKAAYESERTLLNIVDDCDLAFVTAGLGGGTGTGSAHVVARLAKAAGALTIAVVTYPFVSEGTLRRQNAEWGLERLREVCDTVVVLPNEKLLEVEGVKDLPIEAAFRVADELLMRSIAGVTEMITKEGLVNLDFEDLRSVMLNGGGMAMIGLGEATGNDRAVDATAEALSSPLLDIDISDARGALVNVVGGPSLTLGEAERCAQEIRERINPYARIIWGATVDKTMGNELRVLLVLTGVKSQQIFGASAHQQMRTMRNRSLEFIN
ncbi:MAG TPA: cell division protein FtsZ [Candidatus Poseidoniales archaeon]|nr:MAG: cell division protein FtsZ [Euryarchaeota archaeon]HHZ73734.1 cell division protein FtsZ [Candidatus Poseidoniales archaeon]PXY75775.1 MAG: cell division protein FtsZ [Euryarchaeota archaeon]PXY79461.1 MAG: cell division protein FtsZ [Euryarchaeota archaeon]HIB23304.1 cell division protein FtsZ [Candidatus Poseidoniales archaeon]